jgi:peptidoglycan/xylan/chitin deacetylase (PgdA/CDA1 family)
LRGEPRTVAAAIPVLLYHSVSDRPALGQERFTVAPQRFIEHIDAIRASDRVPLTIRALAAAIRGDASMPARAVAVTFDDGFEDTPDAVGRLAQCGISSTVFVTSERVGLPGGLDAGALRRLAAGGTEIGAHTVSHPYLDELDDAGAMREIGGGRAALEEHLDRAVTSFAYPHGAYDAGVRTAVIAAGFTAAAAVKNAFSHAHDDPYAIARWTVDEGTSAADLGRILDGSGARLAWSAERLRTRAYRGARRARRQVRSVVADRGGNGT